MIEKQASAPSQAPSKKKDSFETVDRLAKTLDSFALFNGADYVEVEEDRPRKG